MTNEVLVHHGIKGQRWGVRRFQREDGTRTAAGKARERNGEQGSAPAARKTESSNSEKTGLTDAQKATLKKVAIGAGVAVAAGLATYGAIKYSDAIKDKAYHESIRRGEEAFEQLEKDSVFNKYMDSKFINDVRKRYADDYHLAVQSQELENIEETARENASTFRQARATLKGGGRYSNAELNAVGVKTTDTWRTDFEKSLKDDLNEAETSAKREAARKEKELAARAAMVRRAVRSAH